jgi:hypothetical protein
VTVETATYISGLNSTTITAAGAVTGVTDLTTTGNSVLGSASSNTLNVGSGGIIKDASGNTGIGITPTRRLTVGGSANGTAALVDVVYNATQGTSAQLRYIFNHAGSNFWGLGTSGSTGSLIIGQSAATDGGSPTALLTMTTAGDTTALGVAIARSKSANTSRNSTTTLADDPDLIAPLTAGRWAIEAFLPIAAAVGGGANGFKTALAYSGSLGTTDSQIWTSDATLGANTIRTVGTAETVAAISTSGSTPVNYLLVKGFVTPSTSGNLSVQWAQNSSGAQNLTMYAGAYLTCTKVG